MKLKTLVLSVALIGLIGAPTTLYANEVSYSAVVSRTNQEQVDYKIKTSGSNVNLRKGPGTNHSVVTKIPNNSIVTKISDFSNGKWAKTVFVGKGGKEYIGYILYDAKYTSIAPESNTKLGQITGNRVIFRNGDSRSSGKLGYFYKGDTVEILEKAKNGYCKIKVVNTHNKYKNNIGYVHTDYVDIL